MGLLIAILWALLYVAVVVLGVVLVLYLIEKISGEPVPPRAVQLIWVIVLIVCLIIVLSLIAGTLPALPFPRR